MSTHAEDQLRNQADNLIARMPAASAAEAAAEAAEGLVQELLVYQNELEMRINELQREQIRLEEELDHYVEFYDFAPAGYLTLSDTGIVSAINITGAMLLGVERKILLGNSFEQFVAAEYRDLWHQHFMEVLEHDDKFSCELEIQHSDGTRLHTQIDSLRLLRAGREPIVHSVLTDITERKQMFELVREQKEFFRMIAENTDDFIAVLDLKGRRLYNSPAYTSLFGVTSNLKGTDSLAEIHPEDREHIQQVFRKTVQTGIGLRAEYRFVLADGSIRNMESRGGLIRNGQGQALYVVVVSRDVTERKLAEENTSFLAFHDALTKLPNRRLLEDRLEQAIAASKRSGHCGALMFLDLDNFKPLNDNHGHSVGDLLLVEVARRISGCVRKVDTVARFGGDEFVVVLNELAEAMADCAAQASLVAEKIRAALAEPYWLAYNQDGTTQIVHHHCAASIGVALFNGGASPEDALKWADKAMYQAKDGGRDSIQFFDAQVD